MFIKVVHHRICDCRRPTKSVLHWHLNSFFSFLSHFLRGPMTFPFGTTIWTNDSHIFGARKLVGRWQINNPIHLRVTNWLAFMHVLMRVCCDPFIHFSWLANSFSLALCLSFNLIHQLKHGFISHIVAHSRIELIDLIESFNFVTRHL